MASKKTKSNNSVDIILTTTAVGHHTTSNLPIATPYIIKKLLYNHVINVLIETNSKYKQIDK